MKGNDSHQITKQAFEISERLLNRKIYAIPNSYEQFMTFSIRDLKFIDSCQFVALYLGKLVEDLYEGNDEFKNIEK